MANQLAQESSPYLRQHAHNPVAWMPWGDEAFQLARDTDRPVLVSIGYSACHWCHVMERESFDDPTTAAAMNEGFVPVKVDREERPDVDSVYMRAVQTMTGSGGWPLTIFLTPLGVPFYGGTYFPPERRHGMPSFREVLAAVRHAWEHDRDRVEVSAQEIREALGRSVTVRPKQQPDDEPASPATDEELVGEAAKSLAATFDPVHGGFGGAPKFPQPMLISFLLRHHRRTGHGQALAIVLHTLRRMAAGGIHDHLGGGFHRYSVDARWLVPHFEKMLYDNALLARAYLEAWQATGAEDLRRVCESTLDYVLTDLHHPAGGFLAARDADSEGEEGRFYVWTPEQIDAVLGSEHGPMFRRAYDVSTTGNFEGKNILHLPHALDAQFADARIKLLAARSRRAEPFKDTKVITGWSALAARSLAEAGGALGRDDYVAAARACMRFTLASVRDPDGRLLHVWTDGDAKIPALLEDVAALGNALLSLHEVTLETEWLPEVVHLCRDMLAHFWNEEEGVFYDTASDAEPLIVRPREVTDNAVPSGNSLAVELLLRAARLFDEPAWRKVAECVLVREGPAVARWPTAFGHLLALVEEVLAEPIEVVVVGNRQDPMTGALLRATLRPFMPEVVVTGFAPDETVHLPVPLHEGKAEPAGIPAAYVCRGHVCGEAISDPRELTESLASR